MYTLIYILVTPAVFLGEYSSMEACKNAMREIYIVRVNPPGKRLPELEKVVDTQLQYQKSYICVPKKG